MAILQRLPAAPPGAGLDPAMALPEPGWTREPPWRCCLPLPRASRAAGRESQVFCNASSKSVVLEAEA